MVVDSDVLHGLAVDCAADVESGSNYAARKSELRSIISPSDGQTEGGLANGYDDCVRSATAVRKHSRVWSREWGDLCPRKSPGIRKEPAHRRTAVRAARDLTSIRRKCGRASNS